MYAIGVIVWHTCGGNAIQGVSFTCNRTAMGCCARMECAATVAVYLACREHILCCWQHSGGLRQPVIRTAGERPRKKTHTVCVCGGGGGLFLWGVRSSASPTGDTRCPQSLRPRSRPHGLWGSFRWVSRASRSAQVEQQCPAESSIPGPRLQKPRDSATPPEVSRRVAGNRRHPSSRRSQSARDPSWGGGQRSGSRQQPCRGTDPVGHPRPTICGTCVSVVLLRMVSTNAWTCRRVMCGDRRRRCSARRCPRTSGGSTRSSSETHICTWYVTAFAMPSRTQRWPTQALMPPTPLRRRRTQGRRDGVCGSHIAGPWGASQCSSGPQSLQQEKGGGGGGASA